MEVVLGILQGLGIFLVVPIVIGLFVGGSVILWRMRKRARVEFFENVCSIDTDCPPGYVCESGVCVPAVLAHR